VYRENLGLNLVRLYKLLYNFSTFQDQIKDYYVIMIKVHVTILIYYVILTIVDLNQCLLDQAKKNPFLFSKEQLRYLRRSSSVLNLLKNQFMKKKK
jgi:hypothetical protein